MKIIYNKLVRDNIPDIIRKDGKEPIIEQVTGENYLKALADKLVEEANEYRDGDLEDVSELTDVLEVIYSILKYKDMTFRELDNITYDKYVERGGFKYGYFLKEITD